jgi:copper chaperone CopZ
MEKIKGFITVSCILFTINTASAQFVKASLQASGLTCSMCSRATQEALATLSFVESITPDLNTNTFMLYFKKGSPVNIDAIKKKVEDAGFSVARLVLTAHFDHIKIGNETHINYEGNVIHFVNVKNQMLNGDENITLIDKDFISARQFRKYEAIEKMTCYKTGKTDGPCCHVTGKTNSDRVYHVTI